MPKSRCVSVIDFLKIILVYLSAFFIFSVAQAQTGTPPEETKTIEAARSGEAKSETKKDTSSKLKKCESKG